MNKPIEKITTDPAVPVYQAVRWDEKERDLVSLGMGTDRDELWRRAGRICEKYGYPGFSIVEYPVKQAG